MPVATKGTLIAWYLFVFLFLFPIDEAVKQILLWQNAQLPLDQQFIIADLDSRHLLVKTTEKEAIEEALNEELEKNHFDPKSVEE